MLQGVPELWLLYQSIDNVHITSLRLEGAKHAIPNDQHCSIILIQTVSICAMVNLMIDCLVMRIPYLCGDTLWWLAVLRM